MFPYYRIQSLVSSKGYRINIMGDREWEIMPAMYCEVKRGMSVVFTRTYIDVVEDEQDREPCSLVEGRDGQLIAVVRTKSPHVVLAIFDLEAKQAYPSGEGLRVKFQTEVTAIMMERLRRETGTPSFIPN